VMKPTRGFRRPAPIVDSRHGVPAASTTSGTFRATRNQLILQVDSRAIECMNLTTNDDALVTPRKQGVTTVDAPGTTVEPPAVVARSYVWTSPASLIERNWNIAKDASERAVDFSVLFGVEPGSCQVHRSQRSGFRRRRHCDRRAGWAPAR
jgi:hypothetical protein